MRITLTISLLFTCFIIYCQNNISSLKNTIITPHLQSKISGDTNIIYCSTFQIVWNEFKRKAGGDIKLSENLEIVDYLNSGVSAEDYINKEDYFVTSGIATKEYIDKLNNELKQKFNGIFEPIDDTPNTNDYLFYSFLYKNLIFQKEFEYYRNDITFYNNSHNKKIVKGFGINYFDIKNKNKSYRKRIKLLRQFDTYVIPNKNDEYVINVHSKKKNEEIILAKIEPCKTLDETIKNAIELSKNTTNSKHYNICKFAIPEISFELDFTYQELIRKNILNQQFSNFTITEANQTILFKLDKQGAVIKSKSKIKATKGSALLGHESCQSIIFDKPFLLMFKEKDKEYPYFAIWVSNADILKIKE